MSFTIFRRFGIGGAAGNVADAVAYSRDFPMRMRVVK